jgi:cytochrome c2
MKGQRTKSVVARVVVGLLLALGADCHWKPGALAQTSASRSWSYELLPTPETIPDRVFDTALGKYAVWQFPLFEHYRTEAYGPNWAGAIKAIEGGVISVNAAGEFLYFDTNARNIQRLNIRYENNRKGFLSYMAPEPRRWRHIFRFFTTAARERVEEPGQHPWPHNFRFFDIAVRERAKNEFSLLASLIYWHNDRQCYTFRVVELNVPSLQALKSRVYDTDDWSLVFETEPCMRPSKTYGWFGHEGGGAVDVAGDDLYVGVGHFGLYGHGGQPMVSQDPESMYGGIYRVDLRTRRSTRLSMGHRNQSGLIVVNGDVWETEHGPQGGDELNLIRQGSNYGWPKVTLGTQYGEEEWPFSEQFNDGKKVPTGRHFGYTEPIYAWVPSIGVGTLARISGFTPAWEGDFLAGGLADRSLHRLRIADGRVQYDEPIRVGSRIRDISQSDGGPVYILTDDNILMELRLRTDALQARLDEGTPAKYTQMRGWAKAEAVLARCQTCHSFEKGVEGVAGPNLYGVVGRDIGGTNFPNYSTGWLALEGAWTEQRLDRLLADPPSVAPRTSVMALQGSVEDRAVREAILAYMRSNADRPQGR